MPIQIDFSNPSPDAKKILDVLAEQTQAYYWQADTPRDKYGVYFCSSIASYQRKNNKGFTFIKINNDAFARGKFSGVYDVMERGQLRSNQFYRKEEKAGQQWVVKVQKIQDSHTPKILMREHYFTQLAGYKVKPLILTRDHGVMVMEKLKGENLAAIINRDKLTTQQRLDISKAVLKAYQAQVHNKGIIHFDVKAENILVDMNTSPITAKFCDFGFAQHVDENKRHNAGSPLYAAPELYRELGEVNATTDIYALGRLLGYVWGEYKLFTTDRFSINDIASYSSNVQASHVYKKREGLSNENGLLIQQIILRMCAAEQVNRPELQQVLDVFEPITLMGQEHEKKEGRFDQERLINGVYSYLNKLAKKTIELERDDVLDAAERVRQTVRLIRTLTEDLRKSERTEENFKHYIYDCAQLINLLKQDLEGQQYSYDGRESYASTATYLKNFALFLLGFIPYLVAASVNQCVTGNFLFFKEEKSKFPKELDDLEQSIKQVKLGD